MNSTTKVKQSRKSKSNQYDEFLHRIQQPKMKELWEMEEGVIVRNSKIHGKGVFAARNFKKGGVVLKWDCSRTLTLQQVKELPEKEKRCVSHIQGKYVLLKAPERYVNHSCEANTFVKDFCDIAAKDIAEGEEITANYSQEDIPELDLECNCGSVKCKRRIK